MYGTVWKDLEKQEYQHGNQNKHISSDGNELGNVCERTGALKKKDRDRMLALKMKCYIRILRIRWEQKTTNEEVCRRVQCKKNIIPQSALEVGPSHCPNGHLGQGAIHL